MMIVYTDNTNFADLVVSTADWSVSDGATAQPELKPVLDNLLGDGQRFSAEVTACDRWQYLVASETSKRSQYDLLIELRRRGISLPDGLLCLSGAGNGLHGLRQRPWAAVAGNIHLSVHFDPEDLNTPSGIPFMVLAAVSAVDAIDGVTGLTKSPGIKWVNDILIEDAKVGGVLAYSEGVGRNVGSVVLGIGLNVETTPKVEGTPFVPRVGSVADFSSDSAACSQKSVLELLLRALDRNYQALLDGRRMDLIDQYRDRSVLVGKQVTICEDNPDQPLKTIASGRVERIGDNLELHIAGRSEPVTRGRPIIESEI